MPSQTKWSRHFWVIGVLVMVIIGVFYFMVPASPLQAEGITPNQAVPTATATPALKPYPYTTPLPPPMPTILDGLYQRTIDDPSTPTPCRRCAPFRVEGGTWTLNFEAGVYRLANQATGWRTVGSFTVLGDELKLFNDPNCHLAVGTYQWTKQGDSLSLKVVNDGCGFGLRAKNLTTGSWQLEHDAQGCHHDPCQPTSLEAAISGHWPIPAECEATQAQPGSGSFCSAVSQIPVAECEALLAFYHSAGGENWALKRGWLETHTPCDWTGLKCEAGHITLIALNYNNL